MFLGRFILWLAAVTFTVIGAGFLILPETWARAVDIVLPTALARTDLRATYGGFDLAFGLFLAACALRPEWIRPGLLACGLALSGFGAGRLLGMIIEGSADRLMLSFLLAEIVGGSLSFFAFFRSGAGSG